MAKNKNMKDEIYIANYGVGSKLSKDSNKLSDIVRQTSEEIANKFGKRVNNKIVDTTTTLNLSNLFDLNKKNNIKTNRNKIDIDGAAFKDMMQDNSLSAASLLSSEGGRLLNYSNYRSIVENINECSFGLETYVSNILSPDDYTKNIFSYSYNSEETSDSENVVHKLKSIIKKYNIEDITEDIVSDTLTYGDCFVSVLPYSKEFAKYFASTSAQGLLNESAIGLELQESFKTAERTLNEDVNTSEIQTILNESLSNEESTELFEMFGEKNAYSEISKMINENVTIRSVTDLLKTRAQADSDILFSKSDIEIKTYSDKKKKKNTKPMFINGSSIKILEPDRIVALEIDNVCYGYYYIEPGTPLGKEAPANAQLGASYVQNNNPMNPTMTPQPSGNNPGLTASAPGAKNLNLTDEKFELLSRVMLKALSKKLKKDYIADNKQFKDLLYSLLKQRYIFEKGVAITYFMPEEIVHFKADSIFQNIVFFAKIYLGVLTNTVLIKMGRGHDKRIFYVNSGIDNNHEQAVMKVIQDVKTKEFRMSNLGSISSILSLNPGAFDDIYMPSVNGERPVDIEVMPGMDQDINNDFLEFLRKSMIQGMGIPYALLADSESLDFAKQVTAQNANFCRKIVRCQKKLTPGFNQLMRLLYKYEYQYTVDGKETDDKIDINKIEIQFPSPGALNLENTINQFTQVETVADYIAKRYIPDTMDQSNADKLQEFKYRIIADMIPQVDWDRYQNLFESFDDEYQKEQIIKNAQAPQTPENDFNDMSGGY